MDRTFAQRHALLIVAIIPVVAQLVGSGFNIAYNLWHVQPLISGQQQVHLIRAIMVFNVIVYPTAGFCWIAVIWRLHRPCAACLRGESIDDASLFRCRRLAINLPWWMIAIGGIGWLSSVPVILRSLLWAGVDTDPRVPILLTISITVSAMIALTHAFFALEIANHQLLFPILFRDSQPSSIEGAYPLTLRGRGIAWTLSAVFCPIVSILLLFYAPRSESHSQLVFAIVVGVIAIIFGLISAWLMGWLYGSPIRELKKAAQAVARGDLDRQVNLLRADEFGPLIEEFNEMVHGLKEKESLRRTFGLHVGRQAAKQILAQGSVAGGSEREVTVMFVDIRGFTSRSEGCPPSQVVATLNEFLTAMVAIVESEHGGMVNKYLGDGFMALFGVSDNAAPHADDAVAAGVDMLGRLESLNASFANRGIEPLHIGIGIHTGVALIGSIGSEERLEFTAIGDTVNIASRIESLTKQFDRALLLTADTHKRLTNKLDLERLEPAMVKGIREPVTTYAMAASR